LLRRRMWSVATATSFAWWARRFWAFGAGLNHRQRDSATLFVDR
jgi:hypothetical protein